ncbi:hypothetical protein CDD83_8174 [Cordyceps sp. RAO-2017]|nr:hypothetical protein CDD83_8174 [Cordyceps sp. RAO-2017]
MPRYGNAKRQRDAVSDFDLSLVKKARLSQPACCPGSSTRRSAQLAPNLSNPLFPSGFCSLGQDRAGKPVVDRIAALVQFLLASRGRNASDRCQMTVIPQGLPEELNRDERPHDVQEGVGEPEVEEYFRNNIHSVAQSGNTLQRSDRSPMFPDVVPAVSELRISKPVPGMLFGYRYRTCRPSVRLTLAD